MPREENAGRTIAKGARSLSVRKRTSTRAGELRLMYAREGCHAAATPSAGGVSAGNFAWGRELAPGRVRTCPRGDS